MCLRMSSGTRKNISYFDQDICNYNFRKHQSSNPLNNGHVKLVRTITFHSQTHTPFSIYE